MHLFTLAALSLALLITYALAAFALAPVLLWVGLVAFLLLLLLGWFFSQTSSAQLRTQGAGIVVGIILLAVAASVVYRPYPVQLSWYVTLCIVAALGWVVGLGLPPITY